MTNMTKVTFALSLAAFLTGCADPIIGEWEGERVGGEKSELSVDDNGRGNATIYAYSNGTLYSIDFDFDWLETGDDRYELDMECDGPCSELDFTMDCDMFDNKMDCSGDKAWSNFDFEWERYD